MWTTYPGVWRSVGLGRKKPFTPTQLKPPGYMLLEGSHGADYPDVSQFPGLDSSATRSWMWVKGIPM